MKYEYVNDCEQFLINLACHNAKQQLNLFLILKELINFLVS